MEAIVSLFEFIIHFDKHLAEIIADYGIWTYLPLFIIVFCETGLVVTPFLPGDSLLFVVGAFAAGGSLDIKIAFILLIIAAIAGDTVNYHIGKFLGAKAFDSKKLRLIKREYLIKTQNFYERHGGKTIVLARFIPIIRTFAPFVAGAGNMNYIRFLSYNAAGGVAWITLFLLGGYFFGNIPVVKDNFTLVIFAIIFISVLPAVFAYLREKFKQPSLNK